MFLVMLTKDLVGKKYHAGTILQKLAKLLGGKGGGRPDMAQGGATDIAGLNEIDKNIKSILPKILT